MPSWHSYSCAIVLAYQELWHKAIALRGRVNLSQLLNPWSQLMGHNGGGLAVDVVIDGIMDVDVLALREGGAWEGREGKHRRGGKMECGRGRNVERSRGGKVESRTGRKVCVGGGKLKNRRGGKDEQLVWNVGGTLHRYTDVRSYSLHSAPSVSSLSSLVPHTQKC